GEERIKTKCKDLVVMNEEKGFSVSSSAFEAEHFDEVIFTGSAKGILKTFPFLQNKGLEAISQIRYTAVAEVAVGFEKWEGFPLDGFGALIPSKEKRRILGILFMSSLFQNRAPKGGAMLSVFVGGERHPEYVSLSDDELKALVKEELIPILKIPNFNPAIFEISRHQEAIPQYDLLTPDRINAFKAAEEN
ncbi:MAG TPA: FAD-dependent oxidoreductase, partial [Fibrobacteraceae bacterium]|nr:FAD-dependent oxidoreductase [Fibrobacteraceae bacterium]